MGFTSWPATIRPAAGAGLEVDLVGAAMHGVHLLASHNTASCRSIATSTLGCGSVLWVCASLQWSQEVRVEQLSVVSKSNLKLSIIKSNLQLPHRSEEIRVKQLCIVSESSLKLSIIFFKTV